MSNTPGERDNPVSDIPVHPPTPRVGMDYVPFPPQEIESISSSGPISENELDSSQQLQSLGISLQSSRADLDSPSLKKSPDSQATSSSKLTSSDKLSELPPSSPPTRLYSNNMYLNRSPILNSQRPPNRGIRHSLDASVSLPSFASDIEYTSASPSTWNSPPLPSWGDQSPIPVWNSTGNLNSLGNGSDTFPRANTSDRSLSRDPQTPRQRVSFDSDRVSLPTMQNVRQAFSRIHRGSDPTFPSPGLRTSRGAATSGPADRSHSHSKTSPQKDVVDSSNRLASPSPSHSRAASPLRMFQQWSAGLHRHSREDPFVPIDPYLWKSHFKFRFPWSKTDADNDDGIHTHDINNSSDQYCYDHVIGCCLPLPFPCTTSSSSSSHSNSKSLISVSFTNTSTFLTDTLPRQIYLNILLRLPALYFSRVARIFQDAEVSRPDIQRMIDACNGGVGIVGGTQLPLSTSDGTNVAPTSRAGSIYGLAPGIGMAAHIGAAPSSMPVTLPFPEDWTPPLVSPALVRFKHSWEAFIDSLLREWKTLNVVSALLLSAILTMFQIPSAADDPVTRTAALLSLICALMSLSYGCMYIVKFGTMRSMYRASRWAEEARKTNTLIWWNVWVLLAMPAVWMSWSMIFFIASILSFVWRTGSIHDPPDRSPLSPRAALGPRVAITGVFALGMIYFAMIVKTLKRYGAHTGEKGMRGGAAGRISTGHGGRDVDSAMERRGRERERSEARMLRRREEAVAERRDTVEEETDDDVEKKEEEDDNGPLSMSLVSLDGSKAADGTDSEKESKDIK